MSEIIIVGAGGFGREVYEWIQNSSLSGDNNYVKGFLDDNKHALDKFSIKKKVLSKIADYNASPKDKFIIAIGDINLRKKCIEKLRVKKSNFLKLIHSSAIVSSNAHIGDGTIICPNVIVSPNVYIDDFTILNFNSSVAHDCKLGKYSTISPYATMNGFSKIEDEVLLSTHSTLTLGVNVGAKSRISANSVAIKDVPSNSLVLGVPGKIYKNIY